MQYPIQIIRSNRKTLSIEITREGQLLVRSPRRLSKSAIEKFIEEKSSWIDKHLRMVRERQKEMRKAEPFTREDIEQMAEQAVRVIPERVEHYAKIMGATYGRITIRNQKTRWGSCSAKGNLNFNCLLMLVPPDVLDYVVVHELCHLREMNHSLKFWAEVESILPNYKIQKKWLKEKGAMIIGRLQ